MTVKIHSLYTIICVNDFVPALDNFITTLGIWNFIGLGTVYEKN